MAANASIGVIGGRFPTFNIALGKFCEQKSPYNCCSMPHYQLTSPLMNFRSRGHWLSQ